MGKLEREKAKRKMFEHKIRTDEEEAVMKKHRRWAGITAIVGAVALAVCIFLYVMVGVF